MIRILTEEIIRKIAAGEVVERPASVVKELIENSIDAGARNVSVSIWQSGVGGIEVVDDGCGMDERDASLCIEHHATSKITTLDDLLLIKTLGFRGEALSSIAAVSKITIITKKEDMENGVRVYAEGGKITSVTPYASTTGTIIRVENLFFNVPARLKFLKTPRTEENLIFETIRNISLSYPQITFKYKKDGKDVLVLLPSSEHGRIQDVFIGRTIFKTEAHGNAVTFRAYLTPPHEAKKGTHGLVIVVNGRCILDKGIAGAIASAYEGLIEKGFYPQGAIIIEINPELVDVNVHPQKREVRFRDSSLIFGFIRANINSVLKQSPWLKEKGAQGKEEKIGDKLIEKEREIIGVDSLDGLVAAEKPLKYFKNQVFPYRDFLSSGSDFEETTTTTMDFEPLLFPIGQIFSTYIVCEKENEMILIDQHAASERINYEKLRKQYLSGKPFTQMLVMPVVVELEEEEAIAIDENEGLLRSMGIDSTMSGNNCVTLRAVPQILGKENPAPLMKEIAQILCSGEGRTEEIVERILERIACHSSIRAGKSLEKDEIVSLLRELEKVDFGSHCPHGRPILYSISLREIENKFGRR